MYKKKCCLPSELLFQLFDDWSAIKFGLFTNIHNDFMMQNGDVCVHILVHLWQYSVAHWGVRYLNKLSLISD